MGMCYRYVTDAIDPGYGRFLHGDHAYMTADQLAPRPDIFHKYPLETSRNFQLVSRLFDRKNLVNPVIVEFARAMV